MITPMRMSAPTSKSMPWPTPQRPAQAAPVRRESVPAGGDEPCGDGGWLGAWGVLPPHAHCHPGFLLQEVMMFETASRQYIP